MHDEDIVKLFFSRDEQAITVVSKKYGAYCYSVALNIVSRHEDAEECVNDTWLGAWNCMPPQKPDILKYFLAKITRSKAIDRLKMYHTKKRGFGEITLVLEELSECVSEGSDPATEVLTTELTDTINLFLSSLPVRDRQLFVRRYFFTERVDEIAVKAGMSRSNVSVSLHRTREKLKKHLEKEGYLI